MSMSQWLNVDAGPIQLKRVRSALSALVREGQTVVRLAGVLGHDESRAVIHSIGGEIRADVFQAYVDLGEQFGWQITAANQHQIVLAATAATARARTHRPEVDERTIPGSVVDRRQHFAELRALLAEAS
jgi:hypothetical protein